MYTKHKIRCQSCGEKHMIEPGDYCHNHFDTCGIKTWPTNYCGIYVDLEDGFYWISDANGGEERIGKNPPTNERIDDYRENVSAY